MRRLWVLVPTAVIVAQGFFLQRQIGDAAWGTVTAELAGLGWIWFGARRRRRSCQPSA